MFARGMIIGAVILLSGLAPLGARAIAAGNEPVELVKLRNNFESEKKGALRLLQLKYKEDLGKLKAQLLKKQDSKGAQLVEAEINKISGANTKSAKATPKAAPKKAAKRGPIHLVSDKEGRAGSPDYSVNNVYAFKFSHIGKKTTVKYYAAGRKTNDSYGSVWLYTPDNGRFKVYKWSPRDFKKSSAEISSYKELKPKVIDVSRYVRAAGTYKVEFEWQNKGICPLFIKRVEMHTTP